MGSNADEAPAETLTWESLNSGGEQVVLATDIPTLGRIRAEWLDAGRVSVAVARRPLVFERRGGLRVVDGPTGTVLAAVDRGRRIDLVRLADGQMLRWLTPTRLYGEYAFAEYDEQRRLAVRNVVLFGHDGTGVLTADRRELLPPIHPFGSLAESDLLLALGWFLLLIDRP